MNRVREAKQYYYKHGIIDLFRAIARELKREGVHLLLSHKPHLLYHRQQTLRKLFYRKYTDANPLKVLWVDLESIQYYIPSGPVKFGQVVDGDWDRNRRLITDLPHVESIKNRFDEGQSWEETELFHLLLNRPDGAPWIREYDTPEEVLHRLEKIEQVYNPIKDSGYKTQEDLLAKNSAQVFEQNNDAPHPRLNEIGVNIGRDGELLWRHQGLHRLAIAKALDLDTVPVIVLTRHSEWQAVRDTVRESSNDTIDPDLLEHPDLQDLVTR